MKTYGFSEQIINLIHNLCIDNSVRVSTPYGPAQPFKVLRGVRQGCPLSPTIFILFLDPLFLKLEEMGIGYKMVNVSIPGGAFADDMVLTAESNTNLQKMMDHVYTHFFHFGLEICTESRDKTVYTSNREDVEGNTIMYGP